jgi:hypothetical protein
MHVFKTCRLVNTSIMLLLIQFSVNAQTLQAGSIAVIGWNPTTDMVRFATLANIPSGTVIKITDKGWSQSTNSFTSTATGDGVVTWTTSSIIAKGTVLALFLGGTGDAQATTLTNVTTGASLTTDISFTGFTVTDPMGIAGDQIFVYQGADANPFFIFGMNNSAGVVDGTGWNTFIGASLRDSQLPNGAGSQNSLTNGTNAIGMPGGASQLDNVQYTGSTGLNTGAGWLARFSNVSNWTGENTGAGGSSIGSSILISSALPVALLSFTAELKDDDVLLQWKTADEINFGHYEIECSHSGNSFKTLATISTLSGGGNKQYDWLHSNATNQSGKIYYRLKLVDHDGRFAYSKVIIVSPGNKTQHILNISPNPFEGQFSIYLNLPRKTLLNIQLTDLRGAVIMQKKLAVDKGFSSVPVPALDGLPRGSYIVTVIYEEEIYTQKLLKK